MPPSSADHLRPVLGIAFKITSVALLSAMAACVKHLGTDIPSGQTIFARGLISIVVLAVLAWSTGSLRLLKTRNWRSHALRSLSGTISMFCLFTALTLIPFADVMAITFTAPMFLTVLAMLFLRERIHAFRWSALVIGLIGVAAIVGPQLSLGGGGGAFGYAVACGAAVFSALAMMFLRGMSGGGGEHAITITFYFTLTSTAFAALTALAGWPMPSPEQWLFIVMAGVLGVFGQLLLSFSYRYAEASTIAPLDYGNLLMAVMFGYLFFDEIPATGTWVGAPLIIGAGSIILWREYRQRSARPRARLASDA